jgi:Uma2 family endonuclease
MSTPGDEPMCNSSTDSVYQKSTDKKWTYSDYYSWRNGERWELIDGVAYNITPAPTTRHQELSGGLSVQIANHLRGNRCKVYAAPFDVRLPDYEGQPDDEITTVVQPDIVVVCDIGKLDDRGCNGAPNLVIEILAPNTAVRDVKSKFYLYERAGVKEYWIVHPTDKTVMVFKLDESGEYGRPDMYGSNDHVSVTLFGDLVIDLARVFDD